MNPCLTELLSYQDLRDRITEVEKQFHEGILKITPEGSVFMFIDWCLVHNVFQLPNKEFIQALSKRIADINPETILEIGAGRGLISKHLMNELGREIILTDNYSWWTGNGDGVSDDTLDDTKVIKMGYTIALRKYNPDLVLISWIPYGHNWTRYVRKHQSVKGYILIGEGPEGCTGVASDWRTGWKEHYFDDVMKFAICRTDMGFYAGLNLRHTAISYFERPGV